MHHRSLAAFKSARFPLGKGPVAILLAEDPVEIDSTIAHHLRAGFATIMVFAPSETTFEVAPQGRPMADGATPVIIRVDHDPRGADAMLAAVNAVIAKGPGIWMYYGFNAEYLFHPFAESRSVGEMLTFHTEERRDALLTYVIDLYAGDLAAHPDAVDPGDAWLDKSGYYALARKDPDNDWAPMERQLDFFGGLRWRYEEHVPWKRRKIDRIGLFRARPGLALRADHTFNVPEYNTYACKWHNNLTAAICSFRTAKALRLNPGSRDGIESFKWRNSVPFSWESQQLMDLGLMEPGQWF
ncbi:hypothetical protein [Oceaniglobus indicus]|uniref:hypothetical protein n=1 Tax=Oceaniglobus indicus TaxID=2047749 RepID=UPI000C1829DA|nr:hypothetical protein [Oceaniglobus indicus]